MFNREIKVAQSPIFTGRKFFIMAGFLYLAFMSYAVHSVRAQEAQGAQYDENGWRRIQLEDGTWAREKVTYFLPDHLGGTDVEVDEYGTVVARADYLPYGEDRVRLETEASDSHQFTGQEKDGQTGLYYYGARYYDPVIGRFISADPWEGNLNDPQTLNKYTYVLGNPLKYIDPTGLYNKLTNEIEGGDTLSYITGILNEDHGTDYSVADIATMNNISNPDVIHIGDIVSIGTIGENGEIWLKPIDPNVVNEAYWDGLNIGQQKIVHYGRNYYQDGLLPAGEKMAKASINWKKEKWGGAVAHNLAGATGNVDYRGQGRREGQQAIYDSNGKLVTTAENMGTFDFEAPGTNAHLEVDVRPWLEWGNSPSDTTSRWGRIEALNETSLGREALYRLGY